MGQPAEILTTCAVHTGMTVHNGTIAAPAVHVLAEPRKTRDGQWLVRTDRGVVFCGARHRWLVTP